MILKSKECAYNLINPECKNGYRTDYEDATVISYTHLLLVFFYFGILFVEKTCKYCFYLFHFPILIKKTE